MGSSPHLSSLLLYQQGEKCQCRIQNLIIICIINTIMLRVWLAGDIIIDNLS